MTEEEQLIERLVALQREYQDRARPIIDRLAKLRAARPPSPIVIMREMLDTLRPSLMPSPEAEAARERRRIELFGDGQ